jgi:two-component system sensor histidine kinase BaeS
VIEQVGASQLANAAAKGLSLTVQLAGDLRCTADAGRLRQALGNLLGNAIRYTSEGAVGITAEGDQGRVLITVADTGPGISPDDLEHVFDRFWRAEKSRDRRTGGSGLGLAIARHLVEAHGGKVEIASELGKGTVVTVRLPRPE